MTVIHAQSVGGVVGAATQVGGVDSLFSRLLALDSGGCLAFGIDCPIGLPRDFVAAHGLAGDFPTFVCGLPATGAFWSPAATLDEVGPDRPFYPARGVRGMTRLGFAQALGLRDAGGLCRQCDRATALRPAGAPVFWTLGANQTGKAAISAWRDLLGPALRGAAPPRIWPFEGGFRSLLGQGGIVVAETYPADALRQLGMTRVGSKRRQADRRAYAPGLRDAMAGLGVRPAPDLEAAMADGFGADAAGEDRFDCLLGALCVFAVATGARADHVPEDPWVRTWEGWVLGQAA